MSRGTALEPCILSLRLQSQDMCNFQRSTCLVIGLIFHFRSYHYTEEQYKVTLQTPQSMCRVTSIMQGTQQLPWMGRKSYWKVLHLQHWPPPALPASLSPSSKSTFKFSSCQSSWENRRRVCCVTQARVVSWFLQKRRRLALCHTGSQVIRVLTTEKYSTLVIKDHVIACQTHSTVRWWNLLQLCGFSLGEAMPSQDSVPGPAPSSPHPGGHASLKTVSLCVCPCVSVCIHACLCGNVH